MNFGVPGRGHQGDWTLDVDEARPIIAGAVELAQLDELVAACDLQLEAADVAYLEELYRPLDNLLSLGSS
jgi:hypothetical protein